MKTRRECRHGSNKIYLSANYSKTIEQNAVRDYVLTMMTQDAMVFMIGMNCPLRYDIVN